MFGFIFFFIVASLALWMWNRFRYFKQLHKYGLPGPRANIFTGNMREFRYGNKPCHLVIDDWLKQFGDIFGFHMGLHRYVVVKNPDILREIFIKNFRTHHCRPPPSISIEEFSNSILQVRDYEKWKRFRSLMTPCFSVAKIKHMWPRLSQCMDTMLEVVEEAVQNRDGILEAQGLFQALSCDVIASCALAVKTNCQLDQSDPFLHRVRHFMDHAASPITESAYCFPVISYLIHLLIRTFSLTEEVVVMIFDNLRDVMTKRRQQFVSVKHRDVLQSMMDTGVSGNVEETLAGTNDQSSLSDVEIKSNMLVLLLAGYETTANHLIFTAYLLAKHPDVQERLYNELCEKCELHSDPTYDQLASLQYMDQVLCESMRLYPPVVTFVSRHIERSTNLAGYQLPGGVNLMAPVWSLHRDPLVWSEPDVFNPDRFTSEGLQQRSAASSIAAGDSIWLPFGLGPKSCLGQRFALVETKLALMKILLKYSLRLSSTDSSDLKIKVPSVTLCADEPIPITFTPRRETSNV